MEAFLTAGSNVIGKLFAPEVAAYHWMATKLGLMKAADGENNGENNAGDALFGTDPVSGKPYDIHNLPKGQWRMVDFY